jgi:hypothetical protein
VGQVTDAIQWWELISWFLWLGTSIANLKRKSTQFAYYSGLLSGPPWVLDHFNILEAELLQSISIFEEYHYKRVYTWP